MDKSILLKLVNFWPPYLGAGVRVKKMTKDFSVIEVEMKLRFWNKNYVGVHFGGSLYSMVDPFLMLMVMESLGARDYIVWDKIATIRFKKPGKGTVRARFELTPEKVAEIREGVEVKGKVEPVFIVNVVDDEGTVIAEVEKTLYVRRKKS
jgi:acyl-coenzyme A thioesterase PaaI-like protein